MTRRDLLTGGAAAMAAMTAGPGDAGQAGKSVVERLGYRKEDRLFIIHADDVGMCHSVNAATTRALLEGIASSASIMVPCPWFPEIAAWSREHPEADLGLHLTLTSEWRYYRWRPVSPPDQVKGLLDDEGFMWRSVEDVCKHAAPEEVEREIRAQIERARKFGMKPTHLDSHMGTLFEDRRYFDAYVRVAKETGLMPMLPAPTPEILKAAKLLTEDYPALVAKLQAAGYVFLDRLVLTLEGKTLDERKQSFRELVKGLRPGVTELIVHLASDDEEIRHISYSWQARINDYRVLMDPEMKAFVAKEGVKLAGYRTLLPLWKP